MPSHRRSPRWIRQNGECVTLVNTIFEKIKRNLQMISVNRYGGTRVSRQSRLKCQYKYLVRPISGFWSGSCSFLWLFEKVISNYANEPSPIVLVRHTDSSAMPTSEFQRVANAENTHCDKKRTRYSTHNTSTANYRRLKSRNMQISVQILLSCSPGLHVAGMSYKLW